MLHRSFMISFVGGSVSSLSHRRVHSFRTTSLTTLDYETLAIAIDAHTSSISMLKTEREDALEVLLKLRKEYKSLEIDHASQS